jgi:hypothetical protein
METPSPDAAEVLAVLHAAADAIAEVITEHDDWRLADDRAHFGL